MMMRLARLLPALLLSATAAAARSADDAALPRLPPAPAAVAKPLQEVLGDIDAILLAGEALPPDFVLGLLPLPPGERLVAVAYARRAGVLTGPALPLSVLLAEQPEPGP